MKRLTPSDFTDMPWRNGGGVTAEIAKREDEDGLLWRLSTARVETDGAYSLFPGLMRLSAVVEGNGSRITDESTGQVHNALPSEIVQLVGDRLYRGSLINGGFRHLNLVFDPKRISAEMTLVEGVAPKLTPGPRHILYCIEGEVSGAEFGSIAPSDVLVGNSSVLIFAPETRAALVSLSLK